MPIYWAERQRHTNRLARRLASHLFTQKDVTARQLYGLSKLAWITNSYDGEKAAYVISTKIPALGDIFGIDFSNMSLERVADMISDEFNISPKLVMPHSGFTNFYKPYRNSVLTWIESNFLTLDPLYKAAYNAKNERERLQLVEEIAKLPGIPKANHPDQLMKPEYFITPTFFMLDPENRFPLINGNKGVQHLLKVLKVSDTDLVSQYKAMVTLYGKGGIKDAADLDQIREDLPDFVTTDKKTATKKLLEEKNTKTNRELPLKDEADVEAIKSAGTINQRRIHNQITNHLRKLLTKFTILEGNSNSCMFDALVKDYDGNGNDLLIEVKSSIESPHVRMAIGQLFDYWFTLKGDKKPNLAVLLPERPSKEIENFLNWLNVGLLWFENNQLCTEDKNLDSIICKNYQS